ncbi:hypothetical protein, partial [Weizmannia acidilactici]|uniref:hypothetical protein n=1 Tax=Weizmannia acidilactici TaxID=2607726 RepID=UPI001C12ABF9
LPFMKSAERIKLSAERIKKMANGIIPMMKQGPTFRVISGKCIKISNTLIQLKYHFLSVKL